MKGLPSYSCFIAAGVLNHWKRYSNITYARTHHRGGESTEFLSCAAIEKGETETAYSVPTSTLLARFCQSRVCSEKSNVIKCYFIEKDFQGLVWLLNSVIETSLQSEYTR